MQLWDVPHHAYTGSNMQKQYFSNVQTCVLVFSASKPGSWCTLLRYLEAMNWSRDANDRVPLFVYESKDENDSPAPNPLSEEPADGISDASQDEHQAQQWASAHAVMFLRGLSHAELLKTVLCSLSTVQSASTSVS